MVSRKIAILLTMVAATPAVFAQSRFSADGQREQAITARIEQEERANGPYSEGLIGPLSDLALLYQDTGDHGDADSPHRDSRS
jgi:hypothetical protein